MTPLQFMLHQIELIDGCEITKRAVMKVMRRQEGQIIRFSKKELSRPLMVEFAHRLLTDGAHTRPQVRDRLCSRYGVSRVTAYAIINEALCTRPAK